MGDFCHLERAHENMMKIIMCIAVIAIAAAVPSTVIPEEELVQADENFSFDWGKWLIPSPKPTKKPAKKVIKKQEKKLVPGIKKYCQVKAKLHAAKKLACQHASQWCTMWKKWGMHDMAQTECNRMKSLHKELVKGAKKEKAPKGGKSMELVQEDEEFFFNWRKWLIPSPKPTKKPAKKVIKKEKKLVPGIKKYCQVKTKLHAAKKLACQHASEW